MEKQEEVAGLPPPAPSRQGRVFVRFAKESAYFLVPGAFANLAHLSDLLSDRLQGQASFLARTRTRAQ